MLLCGVSFVQNMKCCSAVLAAVVLFLVAPKVHCTISFTGEFSNSVSSNALIVLNFNLNFALLICRAAVYTSRDVSGD